MKKDDASVALKKKAKEVRQDIADCGSGWFICGNSGPVIRWDRLRGAKIVALFFS
jgi:hypothetical protein